MRALILAAGLGTRLGALSDERPKPLLPVCEVPLIRWALALLSGHGITDVAVNLHHRGELIERELGDAVTYSREETILGTGGGIRQLGEWLTQGGRDDFWVVNGKILIDVDLHAVAALHRARAATATLVVRETPDAARWGAIGCTSDGRVTRILDQGGADQSGHPPRHSLVGGSSPRSARLADDQSGHPPRHSLVGGSSPRSARLADDQSGHPPRHSLVGGSSPRSARLADDQSGHLCMFTGVHLLSPRILDRLPASGPSDSIRQAYIPALLDGDPLAAYRLEGYFHEHSTPGRYLAGNWNALAGTTGIRHLPGPVNGIDPTAEASASVDLRPPYLIGPGARLGAGAVIGPNVVIGARSRVLPGARLDHVVVWPDSEIGGMLSSAIVTPRGVQPV